ncbi:MAG: ATP-binding cassette domain-containing protein [Ruminobacter sp.]|uniref:ATP-binding cassette domain-containing protein n=1 Tax=Ruminobacter sp. TaxID=2774296 RepID=UPI00257DF0A9|nr:ATP-binding cassette domain-containing protein [Ruminobacter sp.]MBQ3774835.1 ATP-binding cassette domain-containing protein [Ruminobacter sp.]
MALVTLDNIYLSYSDAPLFDHACLAIEEHDRMAIVGRNGAGKSTLLKIIEGLIKPDDGRCIVQQGIRIARLEQDPPAHLELPVYCYVAEGIPGIGSQLSAYYQLINDDSGADNTARMAEISCQLDKEEGWNYDTEIYRLLNLVGLSPETSMSSLSGGWLRKVALARALVSSPDLLLLDEPTNHIDIKSIIWLQDFLSSFRGAVVFISHDRSFINDVALRIADVDRGRISVFDGNYDSYVQAKQEALRLEEIANADFDRRLSIEEAWIRKGIKARLTRSDSRVRRLKEMRREHRERRARLGNVRMRIDDKEISGNIVLEAENLCFNNGEKDIIRDFSTIVLRGDKIGVVGANGVGKTTLIKMILGQLQPTSGTLKLGSNLKIAYFDQYREQLDPEKTVMDNLAHGKSEVEVAGRKQHVLGYLQDFLFSPQRARTPVKALSGGEKNRLLLARIFLRPCNILILDEPTNDLDIDTLDLLEELLDSYQATLIVVSHDRYFIDNVATDTWYFDGSGKIFENVGGYTDLKETLARMELSNGSEQKAKNSEPVKKEEPVQPKRDRKRKLSFKETKELEQLPQEIEKADGRIQEIEEIFAGVDYGSQSEEYKKNIQQEYNALTERLEWLYQRWEELEKINNA